MKWTNRKLMILTWLFAPLFPIYLLAELFLDWRETKWHYKSEEM